MEVKRKAVTLKLSDIVPYENNPRINDAAVEAVKVSMQQCGVIAPIIVDENNVILAGHTRLRALKELGYEEAECIRDIGLTEDQKRKFRILDNKTAELAEWDEDLLNDELAYLDLDDFRWFDQPVAIEANGPKLVEDNNEIRCPRCGALVDEIK